MNSKKFDRKLDDFFRNYQDRGMKKWAGFFLSDHTAKINQSKKQRSIVFSKKPEMSPTEISQILLTAFCKHQLVSLQLKELDQDGNLPADIEGFVEGYTNQDSIIISGIPVPLTEINHVEIKGCSEKW